MTTTITCSVCGAPATIGTKDQTIVCQSCWNETPGNDHLRKPQGHVNDRKEGA